MTFEKHKKREYCFIIFLIVLGMLLVGTFFIQGIQRLLLSEVESALTEIAVHGGVAVDSKFESRLELLRSIAALDFMRDNKASQERKLEILGQMVKENAFVNVGFSDEKGNAILSDGRKMYIGNYNYFIKAQQGIPNVSDNLVDKVGYGRNVVVHAVPVYDLNRVFIGSIFAIDKTEQLVDIIGDIYNGDDRKTLILSKDGTVIADEGRADAVHLNFFYSIYNETDGSDYNNLRYIMENSLSGAGQCIYNGNSEIVGVAPLKNTEKWYIAIMAPADSVMQKANKILLMTSVLGGVLILFVALAFAYFYFFNKKYMEEKYLVGIANKRLEESDLRLKGKDQFIANVSHEIRTPMNAIVGMTYFLKGTNLTKEQTNYIHKIESSTTLLLGIINDILDISKIREGKLKLYKQPFALSEVLRIIDDIFASRIAEKKILWRIDNRLVEDPYVIGDKQRLIQIVVNIVNNAYKFTEKGKIVLSIEEVHSDEQSLELLFGVEDTGIGIAKENLSKLFVPFEQLEAALTKVYEGTGLGLSICNRFVQLMEGRLWVDSVLGKGSKFQFTVRLIRAKEQRGRESSFDFDINSFDLKALRVLLVEDNEINAEIASMLMDEIGVQYDWAQDGLQAVEMCREAEARYYNLILMDIHMPNLNGYDAAKHIRDQLSLTLPIVALTATVVDNETIELYKGYIDGYLLKPFDAETFKSTVVKYLVGIDFKRS